MRRGEYTLPREALAAGLSYRRLDYWTNCGHLHAYREAVGSGHNRHWPDSEIEIALRMLQLTRAGFNIAAAAAIARKGPGRHHVGHGVTVQVDDETMPDALTADTIRAVLETLSSEGVATWLRAWLDAGPEQRERMALAITTDPNGG